MRTTISCEAGTELGPRAANTVLAVILVGVGFICLLSAYEKPFWFDEILTVIMCRLPSVSKLWQALGNAADTNPPLFYLVVGWAPRFISDEHLAYRLPSILGLLLTIICVYLVLSRRTDRLSAMAGAAFLLCTPLVAYAVEARPYAMMIGCVAVAIVAWQRIDESSFYTLLLGMALAMALSLHYYAILVWPVFVLSEATVWLYGHHLRIGTWTALALSIAPLFIFARFLIRLREYYGLNFWSHATFGQIFSAPRELYNFLDYWIWCFTIGVIVVLALWAFGKTIKSDSSEQRKAAERRIPIEECILIAAFLLLPAYAVLAAKITGAGMNFRYMLPTVLGASLAVGLLTSRMPTALRAVLLILIFGNYGLSSLPVLRKALTGSLLMKRAAVAHEGEAILAAYQKFGLPIVIARGSKYLPMVYYMPAGQSVGLYALADPRAAVTFHKSDSMDRALLALRPYFPVQVENFPRFASKNREFILVSQHGPRLDWWPIRLSHDGDTLSLLLADNRMQVYKVTLTSQLTSGDRAPGDMHGADTGAENRPSK